MAPEHQHLCVAATPCKRIWTVQVATTAEYKIIVGLQQVAQDLQSQCQLKQHAGSIASSGASQGLEALAFAVHQGHVASTA